jgi:hypothetical protein
MKSLALPAAASAAAAGAGLPVIAGQAGMAATQFITSTIQARQAAEEARRSAVGYLLGTGSGHHDRANPPYVPPRIRTRPHSYGGRRIAKRSPVADRGYVAPAAARLRNCPRPGT